MSAEAARKSHYEVFSIREYTQDRQIKSAWTRLGMAFENQDGSFNIRLNALPITNVETGTANLHMRLYQPPKSDEVDDVDKLMPDAAPGNMGTAPGSGEFPPEEL